MANSMASSIQYCAFMHPNYPSYPEVTIVNEIVSGHAPTRFFRSSKSYNVSLPIMRTSIVVGTRFHSVTLADTLSRLGEEVLIYSSVPAHRFRSALHQHSVRFVPMVATIAKKLSRVDLGKFTEKESVWFDKMAQLRLADCDVLYGWAGYSLGCGKKVKEKGGVYLLERSCPHVHYQEEILHREADALEINYQAKSNAWIERCIQEYEEADKIIVPSKYSYQSFIREGVSSKKLFVAPLDKPAKIPMRKPPRRDKNGPFVVGTLGGNLLRKGYKYLLEAWDEMRLPNAKLLIKANEEDLRTSPVLSKILDKNKSIEFAGYFDDINDFYQQCDVFCLPSVDDGFGLAALEAMGNRVPIIITEHVGAKDVLETAKAGYVVDAFQSGAIADKIMHLCRNTEDREEMGQLGYDHIRSLARPASSQYEKQMTTLYQNVVIPLLAKRRPTVLQRLSTTTRRVLTD